MMNSTLWLFSWTFSAPFLYVLTNHWISQGFSERQLWNSTKVQILEVLGTSIVTEKSQHTIIKFPMCSIVRRSNSYNIHTNALQFAPALVTEKKWTIEVAQKKIKITTLTLFQDLRCTIDDNKFFLEPKSLDENMSLIFPNKKSGY